MDDLVDAMIQEGTLRTPRIINAFRAVDRVDFVPDDVKAQAHLDVPLPIGFEQTISQPTTVAFMMELLSPQPGDHILDIGSGSGWTTALLSHIVGPEGSVLGLERIPELVAFGNENLMAHAIDNASIERAGTVLGSPRKAPFDRILVSAAARTFPNELVSQIREHGVLVLPVRDAIWRVVRIAHQPSIEKFNGFVFVPLITES